MTQPRWIVWLTGELMGQKKQTNYAAASEFSKLSAHPFLKFYNANLNEIKITWKPAYI